MKLYSETAFNGDFFNLNLVNMSTESKNESPEK